MTRPADLLAAIFSPGSLTSLFQPIFHCGASTARVHAIECLTRGPAGTNLEAAGVLFEYARRKGQVVALDRLCLEYALERAPELPADASFSVNVHALTLERDLEFHRFLTRLTRSAGIEPSRLVLEIVEHAPTWAGAQLLATLAKLRDTGVRIALDDIGAGQSTYRMMLDCQPDYFKVDRFIVHGCHHDARRQAVLESVAQLARQLGSLVVAEGIECQEELEVVTGLGIHLVQGYLLAPPVAAGDIRRYWEQPS